ncbi:MAG TPA: aldehyde dehydrogenase family protein, partial [Polyangiaceae bacterium]|nr:aldehyde dehydrogenase family protein [Polyangiaceae bacterium]
MSALGEATGGATGPPATSEPEIDRAVARLNDSAEAFAGTPAASKAKLLRDVRSRLYELAPRLADAGCTAKGINLEDEVYGEELLAGPVTTLHYVRVLEQSLLDIAEHGLPVIPSECFREHGAGSSVQVLPIGSLDRMRFASITAEAWLDAPPARASSARAGWYRDARKRASTGLVLGAGNIPAIPAMDALHELFVAGRCCLLKMSPVNEYLGPLLELALAPLIARGYLAIVYGGPQVGAYCCAHPGIAAVHITGSSETHDLIVWGDEPERSQRKARAEPLLKKTITSELGNVTPVIVPPGEYGDRELEHLARSIAGMMVHNASFNCISAKMLILPQAAAFREQLLSRLGRELEQVPTRRAYYPGAGQRYSSFVRGRNVREIGSAEGERLPWALVT